MAFDPLNWLDEELNSLSSRHLLRTLSTRDGMQSGAIKFATAPNLINFSAIDYLGLAADKRLIDAATQAARTEGWGAGASPLVTGRSNSHAELERRLAEFE